MSCPAPAVLESFAAGRLPRDQSRDLEDHVRECEPCSASLALALDHAGQPLAGVRDSATSRTDLRAAAMNAPATSESESRGPATLDAPVLDASPRTLGPYRIAGLLGRGGMGLVYRAHHADSGRPVALKTVGPRNRWAFAGMREEIAFLKNARHPGIVEIIDYDLRGGDPWYAMELLEGETLEHRHQELWRVQSEHAPRVSAVGGGAHPAFAPDVPRSLPPAAAGRLVELLTLYARLCEPLAFMHRAGIVHCDLKPANIFLRDGREPVLVDFGLASQARGAIGRETLHVAGRMGGTLPYLAPEVAHGEIPDARADLYALGCMLYETLTGQPPAWIKRYGPARRQADSPPPRPSELVADVPAELDELVMNLLARRPQDRVSQAEDVAAVLIAMGARVDASEPPRRQTPAYLLRPRLVGREAATSMVLACCRRAHHGQGSFVLVRGQSGIGKTFFASELSQKGAVAGLQVITGECLPGISAAPNVSDVHGGPMQPLRRFFAAIVDRCHELGEGETARILGDHGKLLVPYEPGFATVPGAERWAEPAPLPPPAARERLTLAVADVLTRFSSTGPLLLTLDDLHWADDLSLAVLDALDAGFFERSWMVILGTYRTDEAGDVLLRLSSKPGTVSLDLEPLTDDDVGRIVGDMLSMPAPPQSLVREIAGRSAGVPFFAAEYLRAMAAEGLLERGDGRWQLPREMDVAQLLSEVSFPTSLLEIMGRRLGLLSPNARAAVEAAAVLGRAFELDVLYATVETPDGLRILALGEAVDGQVVADKGAGRYEFLHDKIRETVYRGLSVEHRRDLHAAAARALEARLGDGSPPEGRFAELAHHFRAAGDARRAIEYLERAGQHALRLSSDADGARYFRDALELEATLPSRLPVETRISWQRQIGEALQAVGRVGESIAPLTAAVSLAGYPMPQGTIGLTLGLLAQVARQAGRRAMPERIADRRPVEGKASLEAGRAYDALQRAYYYTGQMTELIFANLCCVNVLERVERTPELAVAYSLAGMTAAYAHESLGQAYYRLALDAIGKCTDLAAESHVHMTLALHFMARGRGADAIQHAERAVSLADEAGYFLRRDECLAVRAAVDIVAGRHGAPQPWLDRLASSAVRRQDRHMLSWSCFQQTQCSLLRGDVTGARAKLETVAPFLQELERPDRIWCLSLQASAAMLEDKVDEARDACERGDALAAQGPPIQQYCIDAYARLAEVRLHLWSLARGSAREAADSRAAAAACNVVTAAARMYKVAGPMAQLHRGTWHWLADRRAKALSTWTDALTLTRGMDMPILEARLAYALGRSSASAESAQHLARSRAIFDDLGVPEPAGYCFGPAE
jgi:eukaryotic-like serine/threonine-protein kinase